MKKVFISQPMRGKTEELILQERDRAISKVKEIFNDDVEVIDSYFEDYNPNNGCIPLKYLSKSLELLADADIAYFIGEWNQYRGCKIEYTCAIEYGIQTITE